MQGNGDGIITGTAVTAVEVRDSKEFCMFQHTGREVNWKLCDLLPDVEEECVTSPMSNDHDGEGC